MLNTIVNLLSEGTYFWLTWNNHSLSYCSKIALTLLDKASDYLISNYKQFYIAEYGKKGHTTY